MADELRRLQPAREASTWSIELGLHWKLFVAPVLFALVVSVPLAWIALYGTWSALAWIPLGLAILWLVAALIKRQTSEFVVTNKRVLMKVGVFTTRSIELLLNKVESNNSPPELDRSVARLWRHCPHREWRNQ